MPRPRALGNRDVSQQLLGLGMRLNWSKVMNYSSFREKVLHCVVNIFTTIVSEQMFHSLLELSFRLDNKVMYSFCSGTSIFHERYPNHSCKVINECHIVVAVAYRRRHWCVTTDIAIYDLEWLNQSSATQWPKCRSRMSSRQCTEESICLLSFVDIQKSKALDQRYVSSM